MFAASIQGEVVLAKSKSQSGLGTTQAWFSMGELLCGRGSCVPGPRFPLVSLSGSQVHATQSSLLYWTKYQDTQDCTGLRLEIRIYGLKFRDVENKEGMIKGTKNIWKNPRFVLFWVGEIIFFCLLCGMSFSFSMKLVFRHSEKNVALEFCQHLTASQIVNPRVCKQNHCLTYPQSHISITQRRTFHTVVIE